MYNGAMDNWIEIGPAVHPVDGQGGIVYRTLIGHEVLVSCGSVRRLPRDWREHQPERTGLAHAEQIASRR